MYKIKIIEKSGAFCEYTFNKVEDCNPTALGHGLPERIVLADSEYDPEDVIEEIPAVTETRTIKKTVPLQEIINEDGTSTIIPEQEVMEEYQEVITPAMVRLRAEYTIEGPVDMAAEIKWQEYQTLRASILSEKYDFLEVASWLSDDSRLRAITFRKEVRMLRKHLTKDNIMDFDLGSIKTFSFEYDLEYRVDGEQPKVIHF